MQSSLFAVLLLSFLFTEVTLRNTDKRSIEGFDLKNYDYIQPEGHVKEVDGTYIAYPDAQLGELQTGDSAEKSEERESAEKSEEGNIEEKQKKLNCIPRGEAPEPKPKLHRTGGINAEYDPDYQQLNGEDDDPYNGFPINETTSSNVTDVGETVELRTIRPLCDD